VGTTFQDCGTSIAPSAQVYDTSAGLQSFVGCSFVTTRTTSASGLKSDSNPGRCVITASQFDSGTTGNLLELSGSLNGVANCSFLSFGSGANSAIHVPGTYNRITGNNFVPAGANGTAVLEVSASSDHNIITDNSFSGSYAGGSPLSLYGNHTIARSNAGYNPVGSLGPPAFPGSNTALVNPYNVDATIFITGGSVTVVKIGTVTTGLTSGQFFLPAGQSITLTYSSAPTWIWIGN
jgi:hypothetical protein